MLKIWKQPLHSIDRYRNVLLKNGTIVHVLTKDEISTPIDDLPHDYVKEYDWSWQWGEATRWYLKGNWNPIWQRPMTDDEREELAHTNGKWKHHKAIAKELYDEAGFKTCYTWRNDD